MKAKKEKNITSARRFEAFLIIFIVCIFIILVFLSAWKMNTAFETAGISESAADAGVIHNTAIILLAAVAVMLLIMAVLSVFFLRKMSEKEKAMIFEKKRNDLLLVESGGEHFVYDVISKTVTGSGSMFGRHENAEPQDFSAVIRELRKIDSGTEDYLDRVTDVIGEVILSDETRIIERPLTLHGNYMWVKTVLVPYKEDGINVTHVLGSMIDISYMHREFEKSVSILKNMPGGSHRCCLSTDPAALEYISSGLCRLLGYTMAEINKIAGGRYERLIYEEDRPGFEEFIKALSENPGTKTSEYRMVCKDGHLITVSDTMESVMTEDGTMYGYSAVTDITEKAAELSNAREQMQESREKSIMLEKELRESRISNSFSQMQPHFLYNALASIREVVLEDPEYASDLIYDFSTHLRACIRSMSGSTLVPFSQEIENIKAYVSIEKMRFGERLNIQYDIKCCDFFIVPLSVQPLVENAIRHGIYQRGRTGGTVYVSASETEGFYAVTVRDDGVGFDYEKLKEEVSRGERDSTGLANLTFRLEKMLNAEVKIKSTVGVGTTVTVMIPKKFPEEGAEK